MSDEEKDFYNCADEFIYLANDLVGDRARSRVSAAMMFASARFSVFNAKVSDECQGGEKLVDYLVDEYREMLRHNLADPTVIEERRAAMET